MTTTQPVLVTDRLVMRPPTAEDVQAVFDLTSDSRTTAHNPSDLLRTLQQAEDLLESWIRHWETFGFGYWLACQHPSTEVIGVCGLKVVSFRAAPALNLLYRFAPTVWGRGLATEAASAVVGWSRSNEPGRPLIARVRPGNLASQHVAVNAGLRRAPSYDDQGEDGPDLLFTA